DLSRCFYHTEKGCVLNEYKSPVCISAICKDMKEYLAGEFGVEYQVYDVETGMEGILSGLMKVEDIEKFKTKLKSYLSKVSEKLC
ncbi:MAG: hypothetical protein PHW96_03795, partial [Candidatus Nanoarchaeia archaeon]|nr:hypothetical protein [Candidatus Nanoarchaeia archaeon]